MGNIPSILFNSFLVSTIIFIEDQNAINLTYELKFTANSTVYTIVATQTSVDAEVCYWKVCTFLGIYQYAYYVVVELW